MSTVLTLHCTSRAADYVTLDRDDQGEVLLQVIEIGGKCSVWLSREDQRRLFNWLGVQLHK